MIQRGGRGAEKGPVRIDHHGLDSAMDEQCGISTSARREGVRPKPLPHVKVCTFVCTLASSNPVYGQKIVLGISGRIPYSYSGIVKSGFCAAGFQSRRAQRVFQDHRADNNRTCIGRALGRIPFRKAL